jgi:DNA helicase-2/ATP-dependent DNA helicase PcrA
VSDLARGMKVEHPKFGFGKVIDVEINGTSKKANIDFDVHGQKTLLLSFAKLRIL